MKWTTKRDIKFSSLWNNKRGRVRNKAMECASLWDMAYCRV